MGNHQWLMASGRICCLCTWLLAACWASAGTLPDKSTTYYGVVTSEGQAVPNLSGIIRIKITKKGSLSGRFSPDSKPQRFKGKMEQDGSLLTKIQYRYKYPDYLGSTYYDDSISIRLGTVTLQLDDTGTHLTGQIEYRNSLGGRLLDLDAWAEVKGSKNAPAPGTGEYQFLLADGETQAGAGEASIKTSGRIKIQGELTDGRRFKIKTSLCEGNRIPACKFLSGPRGILQGWFGIDSETGRLQGELDWNTTGPQSNPPDPLEAYRILDVVDQQPL